MVIANGGNDTGDGVEHIGRVISPAEAHFDNRVIRCMFGKSQKRRRRCRFEKGEGLSCVGLHDALQHIEKNIIGNLFGGQSDAFVKAH